MPPIKSACVAAFILASAPLSACDSHGGTVMPIQFYDPVNVTIKSSSGGSITVSTTPFQI
jgi:hypothetical protein